MNKLKKIIIFYPNSERGGVINNLIHISNYLSNYYEIHLITDEKNIKKFKFNKNIKFIQFEKLNKVFNIFYKFFSTIKATYTLYFNLRKNNKENTIVFSVQSHILAIIVCKILDFRIIIRNSEDILASTLYADNYLKSLFIFIFKFFTYNFSNKIITNSKESLNSLKKIVFSKKKIALIYNPYLVKINKNNIISKRKDIILNVGRFCKQKNQIQLIDAFDNFKQHYPNFKLFLVGDGYKKRNILEYIKVKKLQKKVIVKKWSGNLREYYLKSKFFVLSSLYEGLPNVLIDSINYKLPIVSTKVSGAKDILMGNKGGYLAEVNNKNSLLLNMIACQNNYKNSIKKILYAKKFLNRFLLEKQNKKYLKLIKNI
jgi:glycosyltransferase involved in cell wall biosynthesis